MKQKIKKAFKIFLIGLGIIAAGLVCGLFIFFGIKWFGFATIILFLMYLNASADIEILKKKLEIHELKTRSKFMAVERELDIRFNRY